MKNRVHDAPVKIIQILPVDNNSSNQPLKPADFSFFKKLIQACRQTVTRTTAIPSPKDLAQEQEAEPRPADHASMGKPGGEIFNAVVETSSEVPVQRSDTMSGMPPGLEWPDRAPAIVVRDIIVIRDQPPPPPPVEVTPVEPIHTEAGDMDLPAQPSDVRHRLEAVKARIAGRWHRGKERIALLRTALMAKIFSVAQAVRQSLATVRPAFKRRWDAASHGVVRRTRHLERRVHKMTTRAALLEAKNDAKKDETESVARELTHELEITKSTLLAQQQALENVTVQLNAVQKELARHKHLLGGLMTQVEAVDLKIVRTLHSTAPRKSKSNADAGQARRASAKKESPAVERSREQRV
ncbi:MAG TPA: hypothetical protein VJ692_11505 [Nitrospiraceae bacterium]|nr:hypothetical protein [Nitrospiraceae bacterium]